MRSCKLHWLLLVTIVLISSAGTAQKKLEVDANDRKLVGKTIEYLIDSTKHMSANEVIGKPFEECKTDILNIGNNSSNLWVRFSVVSKTERDLFLEIQAPLLSGLELYEIVNGTPQQIFRGGMNEPFNHRPIRSQNWLFDLDLADQSVHTYYIKSSSDFPLLFPIVVASKDKYAEYSQGLNIFWGLYIGIILFAFLYNLFIYLSVREKRYLYYILYILGSAIFYLGLEGFSFKFFWPDLPYLNYLLPVLICVTNVIIVLFGINFLSITQQQRWLLYFGRGIIVGFLAIAVFNIAGFLGPAAGLAQLLSLITCVYLITLGISSLKRNVPTAKYFLIAWTLFLTFVFIYILAINNAIPSNFFTTHCIFIGHTTEVCLLSFALADRINWLKSENERKQKEIIHQLKINEQIQIERSLLIEQQKGQLEKQVAERTAALRQSLDDLKTTQKQLIQKEKMASLGELTAGIAHEIQNPLNFVNNFSELNKELIAELKVEIEKSNLEEAKALSNVIEENEQKIMHHGRRADSIVKGMLQHSRASTGKKERIDINSLLNECVRLSFHGMRVKDKAFNAEVKWDLDESIGSINVVPQDISRVLLNLLNNAFYAVSEAVALKQGQDYNPTISLCTKKLDGKVEIHVKDNGCGIPQSIIDKIFQPFFTTKPTGQGTGLGLSLSYDIVKAHGGEIKVESIEGEGSEFIVNLPLNA